MRKILPQAYSYYSEDKILSITRSLGAKAILQKAQHLLVFQGVANDKNVPNIIFCTKIFIAVFPLCTISYEFHIFCIKFFIDLLCILDLNFTDTTSRIFFSSFSELNRNIPFFLQGL